MKALFMGRKPAASEALRHLVDAGVEVVAVVAPQHPSESSRETFWRPLLRDTARELGLAVVSDEVVYHALSSGQPLFAGGPDLGGIDLVLSFLYWKRIRRSLIDLPRVGCFNFHPGPLPEFRGRRGYNFAILDAVPEYGASCHWVAEEIDEGDLVEVRRFPVGAHETALSLESRTMRVLVEMFDDFIARVTAGIEVPRRPQGAGRSVSRGQMLAAMRADLTEAPDELERKIRAFWYPPHHGAYVEVGGRKYTLVDEETLSRLGRFLHGSRSKPY